MRFILLDGPRDLISQRMIGRKGHFMPQSLLDSQLATLEKPQGGASKGKRKGRYGGGIFAGQIGKTRGIWQRDGSGKTRTLKPLFIFTSKQPLYRARLDFEGIALQTANTHFKTEFNRAFEELRAKGKV